MQVSLSLDVGLGVVEAEMAVQADRKRIRAKEVLPGAAILSRSDTKLKIEIGMQVRGVT